MKRALRISLLLAILFIVADETWTALATLLHKSYIASLTDNPWPSFAFEGAYLLLSAAVFIAAGAIVTCFISGRRIALLLAFVFGVAIPTSRLIFEQPRPWFYQDHGVTWLLLAISWANWWLPTLGTCLGAIGAHTLRSRLAKT